MDTRTTTTKYLPVTPGAPMQGITVNTAIGTLHLYPEAWNWTVRVPHPERDMEIAVTGPDNAFALADHIDHLSHLPGHRPTAYKHLRQAAEILAALQVTIRCPLLEEM